jgi:hypothetical protein
MTRRRFVSAAASSGLTAAAAAPADPPQISYYHLQYFYMRSGPQVERTTAYLRDGYLPAARRAGISPVGFFNPVIGERSPFILRIAAYSSWTAIQASNARLEADKELQKAREDYDDIQQPGYIRVSSELLRAFPRIPALELPPGDPKRAARLFELRTYESINEKASRRKVRMFEDGEAAIFRRLGMAPVFFGQAIIGERLPHLTYMLSFEDLAARERLWSASDPTPNGASCARNLA